MMTTIEKIRNLNDNESLSLFQGFSGYLKNQIQLNEAELIRHPPDVLMDIESLARIQQTELGNLGLRVQTDEVIPVVRIMLEQWANDPAIAPVLEDYIESNDIHTMAAGTILAIGAVITMTLISTSLKVSYNEGKWKISYDSKNISSNAVEIVKAVMDKIPDTLAHIIK
jgi:hypothetical protein